MLFEELSAVGRNKWYRDQGRIADTYYYFVQNFVPGDFRLREEPHFEAIRFHQSEEPVSRRLSIPESRYKQPVSARKVPRKFRIQLAERIRSNRISYDLDNR